MTSLSGESQRPGLAEALSPLERAGLDDLLQELLQRVQEVVDNQQRTKLLLDVVVGVAADLSLSSVLERIVEAASRLAGAQYAALGVISPGRDRRLREFVTYGLTGEQRERIGDLPRGHGLLGLIIDEPEPVRTSDIAAHPASFGFPPNHPPMKSFLGAPIRIRDKVFGNIYLTEKQGAGDFTERDEAIVIALAAAAGVVIENARLYEEAARRERWLSATAEITAALLGPVSRQEALQLVSDQARHMASADLACIVLRVSEDELELQVVSGPDTTAALGAKIPTEASLAGMVLATGETVVVEDVSQDPRVTKEFLAPDSWPELGPTMLVPMRTESGIEGVLSLGWAKANVDVFHEVDIQLPQRFAEQAALALQVARAREDRELLAVFTDRDRIGRDLHDLVIQRLFAIGLSLENTSHMSQQPKVTERVTTAVDDIDATIKDIRRSIFALSAPAESSDLRQAINEVVDRASKALGFTARVETDGPVNAAVTPAIAPHLLAVLGEALSNAARHAQSSAVDVSLHVGDDVELVVRDNGIGIEANVPQSGLRNMKERAEGLRGTCIVDSAPGEGTVITWTVPARGGGST